MSGFVATPGTDFRTGSEPDIAARLDRLAKRLGVTIYGLSGGRTPAHSVAVGGFPNDPHTRGQAADVGVNSQLRSSAGVLTEKDLNSVGLTRPFGGANEINHLQLKAGGGRSTFSKIVNAPGDAAAAAGTSVAHAINGVLGLPNPDPSKSIPDRVQGAGQDVGNAASKAASDAIGGAIGDFWAGSGQHIVVTAGLVLLGAFLVYAGGRRAVTTP